MFAIVYGSATTARFVEQAIIDTDPTDDNAIVLYCGDIWGDHYECNPVMCIVAARNAFNEALDMYDMWYDA